MQRMYVGMCVHMYMGVYAYVCKCMWRPEANLSYVPEAQSILCLETGTLTDLELSDLARLANQ